MKELNQFELKNVAGGDDFAHSVGHAVGNIVQAVGDEIASWFN